MPRLVPGLVCVSTLGGPNWPSTQWLSPASTQMVARKTTRIVGHLTVTSPRLGSRERSPSTPPTKNIRAR
jgi:hypothetical protein